MSDTCYDEFRYGPLPPDYSDSVIDFKVIHGCTIYVGFNPFVFVINEFKPSSKATESYDLAISYYSGPEGIYKVKIADANREYISELLIYDKAVFMSPSVNNREQIWLFFPRSGTYTFKLYLIYGDYVDEIGELTVNVVEDINKYYRHFEPFDKMFYEFISKDDKIYPRLTIKHVELLHDTHKTFVYAVIRDNLTGEEYDGTYNYDELIKPIDNEYGKLSPIGDASLYAMKDTVKYIGIYWDTTFIFDAYGEFIKMLTQWKLEDVKTWFKHRIEEEMNKQLKANNIDGKAYVIDIKLEYDINGILSGTNKNVKVNALIYVVIDPVPNWLVAVVIISVILAILGTTYLLEKISENMKIKAFYEAQKTDREARLKAMEVCEKWIEAYKESIKKGVEPPPKPKACDTEIPKEDIPTPDEVSVKSSFDLTTILYATYGIIGVIAVVYALKLFSSKG